MCPTTPPRHFGTFLVPPPPFLCKKHKIVLLFIKTFLLFNKAYKICANNTFTFALSRHSAMWEAQDSQLHITSKANICSQIDK